MTLPIWARYFIWDVLKVFLLFQVCFYLLYVLIDYTSHTGHLLPFQSKGGVWLLGEYYLHCFVTHVNLLFPLGFLIALVRTLCQLNVHRELVALMAGGVGLHRLMQPFLALGLLLTGFVYANEQLLVPIAERKLKYLEEVHKIEKRKKMKKPRVRSLLLKDQTKFIFQSYEKKQERFFDAYWLRSPEEIYRFQYLYPHEEIPRGLHVDRFLREASGTWDIVEETDEATFPQIHFDREILFGTLTPATDLSLTELWSLRPRHSAPYDERESVLLSTLYWKSAIPWLCLLVVLIPAPICVRFRRHLPLFFIYLGSLFGLIAFYLLLNALTVMAKRQVLTPFWAILPLFFLALGWGTVRYRRMEVSR